VGEWVAYISGDGDGLIGPNRYRVPLFPDRQSSAGDNIDFFYDPIA
jgi:hypothetical protein